MRWLIDKLAAFLALLCRSFDVPLENLDDVQNVYTTAVID